MMDEATTTLLAELNNEGAFLLGRGQLNEAIAVYESALERVTRTLHDMGDRSSSQSSLTEDSLATPLVSEEGAPAIGPNNDHDQAIAAVSSDAGAKTKSPTRCGRKKATGCSTNTNRRRRKGCSTSRRLHKRTSRRMVVVPPRAKHECQIQLEDAEETSDFFLYDKPMRVADRYNIPDPIEVCVFVVYNLALSLHLAAEEAASNALVNYDENSRRSRKHRRKERKNQKSMLKRSLNLYKEAHAMQIHWGIELSESHCLALWNNIAHAFQVLGRDEVADTSLQHLLTMIFYTVFRGYGEDVENMEEFMNNVMHIVFKKSLVVAPAA